MKSVTEISLTDVVASSINKKLIVQGVSWDSYEDILKGFENSNALHFAYDNGDLEIEMPSRKHEKLNRLLAKLIELICEELEIDVDNGGSTTYRNKSKAKGVEPDTCFYIQTEPQVRGQLEIDTQKLPPDLVIEVDVTSPSLDKLPIYAALNVPEVWLYKGERVEILQLVVGNYQEIENSLALPVLNSATITEFLDKGLIESSSQWFRAVREWAQNQSK